MYTFDIQIFIIKKALTLLLVVLVGCHGNAQIVSIPDANFKAKLISNGVDYNNDGEIQESEALNTTALYLDSANITSLEGIQSFSNVTLVRCSYNPLTEMNLCGTAIATLFCINNPNLTSIIVKNNVISQTVWMEPPFPPFITGNLPSLQYICADADELAEAQIYFMMATTNTIMFTSDCDISNCAPVLNTQQFDNNFAISIYPNPIKNTLTLQYKAMATVQTLSIFNTLGHLILTNTNPAETIDVSELKTGTYFMKVISEKGTANGKFIKE